MKAQQFAYNYAGNIEETAEDVEMLGMTNYLEEVSMILSESQSNMFEPAHLNTEAEVYLSTSTKKKAFIKKSSIFPNDENKQNRNDYPTSKRQNQKQKRFPLNDITAKIIQISPSQPSVSFSTGPKPPSIRKRLQF